METKQYTITEKNEWESETWHYVMFLTDEEYDSILKTFDTDESFSIEQSTLSDDDLNLINKYSSTNYLPAIGYYSFQNENVLADFIINPEFNNPFYKSSRLVRAKEHIPQKL